MTEKLQSYPFLLSLIWWSLLLFVNTIGDFPLNDDWAYAHNVQALVEGEIYFSDWPAMTLIAHTLWGALFCKIFGFSFTALRFSTLVMGWIGILATYGLLKESRFSKKHAFWCTLLLTFNPLYFSLAYSYMTDVPFYTFMILASLFFIKALNHKGTHNIILATVFSIIAVLIRQLGILMPMAFLIIYLIKNKTTLKTVFQAVTPLFVTYGIMTAFIQWRATNYGLSETFSNSGDLIKLIKWDRFNFFMNHLANVFVAYWGYFLLPLTTILFPFFIKKTNRKIVGNASFITLLLLIFYWGKWKFNILGNVIYNFGLGPKLISYHSTNKPYQLPTESWSTIKAFAFFAGVFLIFIFLIQIFKFLFSLFEKQKHTTLIDPIKGFAFFSTMIYLGFLTFNFFYFDRYHLPLIPFFILLIFPKEEDFFSSKWVTRIAGFFFVIQVLYSVGSTRDYLSYSRNNWQLLHQNMEQLNLPPDRFAGGFEFNSWYKHGRTKPTNWFEKDWWLSNEKHYATDFGKSCGFSVIDSVEYLNVFPISKRKLFLLGLNDFNQVDTITSDLETITSDSLHFTTNDSTILLQNPETQTSTKSRSGKFAVKVNKENEYALTLKLQDIQPCEKIWIEVYRFPAKGQGAMVLAANDAKAFYEVKGSGVWKIDEEGWGKLGMYVTVPTDFKDNVLNFYLYNSQEKEVWFDDLSITRAKYIMR